MIGSINCDDGFSRDAGSPNTSGRTEPAKRTRAVVQIDQRGDLFYYADGDIDYLVIDERCPRDRVFALSKHKVASIDELIGSDRIGRWGDMQGHRSSNRRIP